VKKFEVSENSKIGNNIFSNVLKFLSMTDSAATKLKEKNNDSTSSKKHDKIVSSVVVDYKINNRRKP
jgi:hypothetical protein